MKESRSVSGFTKLFPMLTLLLLACGLLGGGEADPGADLPPDATVPQGDGAPVLPDQVFTVDREFWHSGFRVLLGDGRFYAEEHEFTDEVRYFVTIAATFENQGGSDTYFDGSLALVTPGGAFPAMLNANHPTVPAGLSAPGEFRFEVGPDFDPETAALLVGRPDENRAQIPLGSQGGDLVDLAPSMPTVSGTISLQLIDLHFAGAELRADRPVSYSQVEAGKLALTLYFDAVNRKGGNWSIHAQDFALILPSGSLVAPDGADLGSLPGSDDGVTTTGLYVRFLIDAPPAGTFTLRFTPGSWLVGDDGVAEGAFEFTLE
ncbi:MAG TPA: hypothetical protein VMN57_03190 [Anaerolineales bacterium]|nr:hypothetical protein [Anaerolineales bacterium]